MRRCYILLIILWAVADGLLVLGQTGTSTILGTLTDSTNAVVPGATVRVRLQATGAVREVSSNSDGLFRVVDLQPGIYTVRVEAPNFKTLDVKDINLASTETHDLGRLVLQVGAVTEAVDVTAKATPVQTASSERSALIDATQLDTVAMKGRDAFGLVGLLPGVTDLTTDRSLAQPGSSSGLYINGMSSNTKNVTFDGVSELDQGGANAVYVNPNVDAIGEMRVLTNAYQAEYGRTAGGGINIVTKSGTRDFHGTLTWQHRNEGMNANSYFNKREDVPRPEYRYFIGGYSLGGPIYIPGHFNTKKQKLFFFVSEEFTRNAQPTTTATGAGVNNATVPGANLPTTAEINGDFSQAYSATGTVIPIIDPTTHQQFPGNIIPPDRINPLGQAILKLFPQPNGYVDPAPGQQFYSNYIAYQTPTFNRRDDIIRIDWMPTSKLALYGRYGDDTSNTLDEFTVAPGIGTLNNFLPGNNLAAHLTYTISNTMVNEFTFGIGHNNYGFNYVNGYKDSQFYRTTLGIDPPTLRPLPSGSQYEPYVPAFSFNGGELQNAGSYDPSATIFGIFPVPYKNFNNDYSTSDDLSKVLGSHILKFGVYYEYNYKSEPLFGGDYAGTYNFGSTPNNPLDTGDGYANALLGIFQTYTESNVRVVPKPHYNEFEAYAQDSWRIGRRVTLDYGVRAYHMGLTVDPSKVYAEFYPSLWNASQAPVLYQETLVGGVPMALNPLTGATANVALVDTLVPGAGNPTDGISVNGKTGKGDFLNYPFLVFSPRVGFAWDVKGDGKTAIRASFGTFYNRPNANFLQGEGGAPVIENPTIYYSQFSQVAGAAASAALSPAQPAAMVPNEKIERNYQFNLTIQRDIGFSTVVDVSYVGNFDRDAQTSYALNPVPLGAYANPANLINGAEIPAALLENTYPGMGAITQWNDNLAAVNYNALQVAAQHRMTHGLQFGAAYVFSKALGTCGAVVPSTGSGNQCAIDDPYHDYRKWYYGPLNWDTTHNFSVNYTYTFPKVTRNSVLKYFTNDWTLSGITEAQSGQPITPSCSAFAVFPDAAETDPSLTGEGFFNPSGFFANPNGARCQIVGNLHQYQHSFNSNFNVNALALAPTGTFGNSGIGILRSPAWWNMDANIQKTIPLGSEKRMLQLRLEAYNVLNHTEFNGIGSGLTMLYLPFNPTPENISTNLGQYTSTRPPRVLATTVRLQF